MSAPNPEQLMNALRRGGPLVAGGGLLAAGKNFNLLDLSACVTLPLPHYWAFANGINCRDQYSRCYGRILLCPVSTHHS